jgi:hypothetical protein
MRVLLFTLLGVGLSGLWVLIRVSRGQQDYYVSTRWVADEAQRRRVAALEFEGVSHQGRFKR